MIISHKYQFIFIKTRKTAGTSIELYLSRFLGPNDIITPIIPPEENFLPQNYKGFFNPYHDVRAPLFNNYKRVLNRFLKRYKYFNHMPAYLVQKRVPSLWRNYFTFTVERDPYQKIISHFYSQKKINKKKYTFEQYLTSNDVAIDHYLYCDKKENQMVDKIIYYENLNYELGNIFNHLHIPYNGTLDIQAKKNKSKNTIDLAPYTNLINNLFQWEFDHLNYTLNNENSNSLS